MSSKFEYYVRYTDDNVADLRSFMNNYNSSLNYSVLPANEIVLFKINDEKTLDVFLLTFSDFIIWDFK